ncbi:SMP-30/gluconolactonase/LRE family protein [Falsirhodobacter halotolerans]|uniref:SMP-30/gluconolactonase/LRE family protein n=1 Tax=Falsirhodobacter halotolerans TaxID=1146892 RepID=UPI001FD4202E|nr:SMP-30/gluconolactonase/LRE family protein [Falsirhodobacter halotolerans]MCJ8141201.1 SMP-30/gluconolactonase/LRE family protein [Falsirhodobacter halotolerans]
MEQPQITIAHPHRSQIGESPVWCDRTQALWWVDIMGMTVQRLSGDDLRQWSFDEPVGCLALTDAGHLVLGLKSGFAHFRPDTGALTHLSAPEPHHPSNRLNDGAVSRGGRFFAASMADPMERADAALHRLDGRRSIQVLDGLHVGNGLAFSADDRTMFASDSWLGVSTIWAFDHDPDTGAISRRRVFRTLDPEFGRPDGATVDAEGFYWIAAVGGGRVLRLRPDGSTDRAIALPVRRPSKPVFGGPDLRTLFITTISDGSPSGPDGQVLKLDPGVAGLPQPLIPDPVTSG